ncbi:MAG: YceI family protein, partial [Ottowia sp.]|nr:YceI family protein [Ottowia sp.]
MTSYFFSPIKRIQKYALLAFVLCTAHSAVGAVEYTQFIPEKSHITFASQQMGVNVDGQFKKLSAHIVFNPQQLKRTQAEIIVDIASIDTGSPPANEEVLGKNWFDVQRFPTARFHALEVKLTNKNTYEAHGKLSIKNKTIDFVAPVTLQEAAGQAQLDGHFIIRRLDFGLGTGSWA